MPKNHMIVVAAIVAACSVFPLAWGIAATTRHSTSELVGGAGVATLPTPVDDHSRNEGEKFVQGDWTNPSPGSSPSDDATEPSSAVTPSPKVEVVGHGGGYLSIEISNAIDLRVDSKFAELRAPYQEEMSRVVAQSNGYKADAAAARQEAKRADEERDEAERRLQVSESKNARLRREHDNARRDTNKERDRLSAELEIERRDHSKSRADLDLVTGQKRALEQRVAELEGLVRGLEKTLGLLFRGNKLFSGAEKARVLSCFLDQYNAAQAEYHIPDFQALAIESGVRLEFLPACLQQLVEDAALSRVPRGPDTAFRPR